MFLWVRDDLADILGSDPFDALERLPKETVRRADNRHTFRFDQGGSAYFAKVHTGVGWRQIFEDLITLKRPVIDARNELAACRRLAEVGICAPTVAAFATQGANPATRRSFVVCDALDGFVSLDQVAQSWRQAPPPPRLRWALTRELACLTRTLHDAGINHRDYYLDHLLADAAALAEGRVELALVDLHRAGLRRRVPARWLQRDLAALSFSAVHAGASAADQFRFLRHYCREVWCREVCREVPGDVCGHDCPVCASASARRRKSVRQNGPAQVADTGSPAQAVRAQRRFWRKVARRAARLAQKGKRDTAAEATRR